MPAIPANFRTCPRFPRLAFAVSFVWLLGSGVAMAGPAEPLLKLAPANTTICVVMQNLRGHIGAIADSPFAEWIGTTAIGQKLQTAPELVRIQEVARFLKVQLGVPPSVMLDEILGDAVVLAYQPGPPERPSDEAGVILIKPRKFETLAKLIAKVNDLQTQSGELQAVAERTYRERGYFARKKANGGYEFYLIREGLFAFSGQEPMIRGIIDRELDEQGGTAKIPPVLVGLRKLDLTEKAAVFWLDPRAFDAELTAKTEATADLREKAFLTQFRKVWNAVDGIAAFAHPTREVELGVTATIRREELPREIVPILFPTEGASVAWAAVPSDALFAVGGRIEIPMLLPALSSFLPGDGRDELRKALLNGLGPVFGRDKLPAVLRGLGPDWAAWMASPPEGGDGWLPQWVGAVRLPHDGQPGDNVTRTLTQAVELGFQLARIGYNQSHTDQIEYGEEKQGAIAVKYLSGEKAFPPGMRPCFAVKSGYLVVASSPEVIALFTAPKPPDNLDPPLLRVSASRVREYLTRHRERISVATSTSTRPAASVVRDLTNAIEVLELFEQFELRYRTEKNRVTFSARIELAKPLTRTAR